MFELEFLNESASDNGSSVNDSNETECGFSLATTSGSLLHYHATVLGVIVIVSLIGNILVLVLFARFKVLRTRSVIVSMSMVVADLLFTLAYTLQVIITTVNAGWAFEDAGCIAFGFMATDLLITRWLILSLLCLDRFLTVRFPFSYRRRGKCLLITFTTLAWVLPLLASIIPPASGSTYFAVRENQPACLPSCQAESFFCRAYYFLIFVTVYVLGSIVPIILYSWLYWKARKLRKSTNHTLGHLTIQIAGGILVSQPVGERNTAVSRDKQATTTFVLIIVIVVITGTPGFILQVLRSLSPRIQCAIPIIVHFIIIEIFLCAPMLTPLVIMRERTFRSCLVKLFHCRRKTGDLQLNNNNISPSADKSFIFNQSRRSSIANALAQPLAQPPQETNSTSISGGETRTQNSANSIALKPTVYTISESCESLPQAPPPT